ncbi:MAG: hypothetical protein KatS3mg009_0007 [Acidimicrobiia bacterium]|nr:MAG: hypothetical protein KatS3mg009_0007 [Acidimicrobiia bacterium]
MARRVLLISMCVLFAASLVPDTAGAQAAPEIAITARTWDGRTPEGLDAGQRLLVSVTGVREGRGQRTLTQCRADATTASFRTACARPLRAIDQQNVQDLELRTGELTPIEAGAPPFRCDHANPCTVGLEYREGTSIVAAAFAPVTFRPPPRTCPVPKLGATELNGSGTVNLEAAFLRWVVDVCTDRDAIGFAGRSSPAGRIEYREGRSDFAVVASPFTTSELDALAQPGDDGKPNPRARFRYVPIAITGLAVPYVYYAKEFDPRTQAVRRSPVTDLRFSPRSLARILNTRAQRIEDDALVADNPRFGTDVGANVWVSARAGQSAWGLSILSYLYSTPEGEEAWEAGRTDQPLPGEAEQYRTGPIEDFPPSSAYTYSRPLLISGFLESPPQGRSEGLNIAVLDTSIAVNVNAAWATIRNADGRYVLPEPENLLAAVAAADRIEDEHGLRLRIDPTKMRGDAYPMTMVSYLVVPETTLSDEEFALVRRFVEHVYTKGQTDLPPGYAPLPDFLVAAGRRQLDQITALRRTPATTPTTVPATGAATDGFDDFGGGFDDFGGFDSGGFGDGGYSGDTGAYDDALAAGGGTVTADDLATPELARRALALILAAPAALPPAAVAAIALAALVGGPAAVRAGRRTGPTARGTRRARLAARWRALTARRARPPDAAGNPSGPVPGAPA